MKDDKLVIDELKEQENPVKLEGSTAGSWIVDFTNKRVEFSSQWSKHISTDGATQNEMFCHIDNLIHPDDVQRVIKERQFIFENRLRMFYIEYRIKTIQNGYQWVLDQGKAVYDKYGNIITVYGTLINIPSKKTSESELGTSPDRPERKIKPINDFVADICHEIKAPLTLIHMQLQLMKSTMNDEVKLKEFIDGAIQNSLRLNRLVTNLLELAKIEAGCLKPNLITTDIVSLVKNICKMASVYANAKSIKISFRTNMLGELISTDPEKIESILLNLIINAVKYTEKNGRIIVGIHEREEGGVVIDIEDTGQGIPKDKLDVIFDRYTQVSDDPRLMAEGCGIGLNIVKSLVELLGGSIRVESEQGKGSKFIIELPKVESELQKVITLDGLDLPKMAAFDRAGSELVHTG
ncbi:MAG: PAS domain-containing sensor histidine kinase [Christensenellales bacterium]